MSNPVKKAMNKSLKKVEKEVGQKAGKQIENELKKKGHGLAKVGKDTAEADAKHAEELLRIHRREPTRDELRARLGDKPVYLMNDKRQIQRLTKNGPVDLTDEDRKILGGSLKLTGAKKDTLPARPKNPDNPYSWGESTPEQRAARSRKQSQEVGFYDDELSRATQLGRHEHGSYGNYKPGKDGTPEFTSNNYAAVRVEYEHEGGKQEFILVGRSQQPVHSEKVLGIPFLENGTGDHIKDMYTERAPCSGSSDCSAWVDKWLPHVNVSHSVEFGPDDDSIARGNREVEDRLNRLHPGPRPNAKSPWKGFTGLHTH